MWNVAEHYAKHGRLPESMNAELAQEIKKYPEKFQDYVQCAKYALAMEELNLPEEEDVPDWDEDIEKHFDLGNPVG